MPRVLLVEFAAVDRFHRAVAFPFVRGRLRDLGLQSQWIRFGLAAGARAEQQERGVGLSPPDTSALLGAVAGLEPSHLLFNQEPATGLVRALRQARPHLHVAFFDDVADGDNDASAEPLLQRLRADSASLAGFLGETQPAQRGSLFEDVVPDFHWEAGNSAAAAAPSLPFLICGEECNYRRGLGANPFFAELDLSSCGRPHGCTFCVRPAEASRWTADAVSLFRSQVEALARTHRPWTGPLAVRAVGEPILSNIEPIARALCELDIGPIHLLVDGRADAIVRHRDHLRNALESLAATRHGLHFSLVGIESFASDELLRYNKGTTWQQNLDAAQILLSLEESFPAHFGFSEWGGLSLILYSPWTRLEDLSLNLAIVRRARLFPLCGKVFTSRVRLYPSLPLHALAAHDGLLIAQYDDPLLDTARRNFYADEVPWRFANPGLEAVSRVMLRLGTTGSSHARDPLSDSVAAMRNLLPAEEDRLAFAERLIDEAIAAPEADARTLLTSARDAWPGQAGAAKEKPDARSAPAAETTRAGIASTLLLAFEIGIKPVVRLENPSQELLSRDLSTLASPIVIATRTRHLGTDIGEELFVGRRRQDVDTAIALTDRMEAAKDDDEWKDAAGQVGVLLGYPQCCATRFASHAPSVRENYTWLYLQARLETPGEVSPLLSPGVEQLVNYIPCSLTCEGTLRIADALGAAIRARMGTDAWDDVVRRSRRPWLLFVDHQGAAVELVTEEDPRSRFRYRVGDVRGAEPLAQRVAEGDELLVDDHQLLVYRRGELHASLSGRAFLWWYRSAVQEDFWRRILALRFAPRRTPHGVAADSDGPPPGHAARELCRFITAAARMGTPRAVSFRGFKVVAADPQREDRAKVVLSSGDHNVRLIVAPRKPADPAYVTAGPLGIHHPQDERIDTVEKDLAVRLLARYLEAALAYRAKQGKRG